MKTIISVMSIIIAVFMLSCEKREQKPQPPQGQPQQSHMPQQQDINVAGPHNVVVQEVIQANSYTYLKVDDDGENIWIAVAKSEIEAGDTISYDKPLKMTNFTSKELDRTFDTIYFVGQFSKGTSPAIGNNPAVPNHPKPEIVTKDISIEPIEGGITIEELFTNKDSYANKTVIVKGQVTKVNLDIMSKNWVHLQDGTGTQGSNDLTITTLETVAVDDVVTFEGTITLNKDFGAGYKYDVIMEQAKIKKN